MSFYNAVFVFIVLLITVVIVVIVVVVICVIIFVFVYFWYLKQAWNNIETVFGKIGTVTFINDNAVLKH